MRTFFIEIKLRKIAADGEYLIRTKYESVCKDFEAAKAKASRYAINDSINENAEIIGLVIEEVKK